MRVGGTQLEIEAASPETAKNESFIVFVAKVRLTSLQMETLKPISVGAHTLQKFYFIYNEAVYRMQFRSDI